MKFTLSWLKEFLDTNASLAEIEARLTSLGLEVESVTDRSQLLAPFKVAEILGAIPHPDAAKLQICRVNTGQEILQIVCGAPNARAGIKVVLAPAGSVIPSNGMVIKLSKIRGVDSNGMLCSARELQIGDDESGIIELPADAIPGTSYSELAGFNDPVIEIAITPNRGDCLGVYGIARDLAASGTGTLKPLALPAINGHFPLPLKVVNHTSGGEFFTGRYFKNVTNKPSPAWLQNRLKAIGVKPISALVDITNYVAFTYGQPMHAYDAHLIDGTLTIRTAKDDELLEALDGKDYKLTPGMTVISDQKKILALAGIIGARTSGCSESTKTVLLESAFFDPVNVATTGRALQIDTDSRYRFERHVDPEFVRQALDIASAMILEICGGEASVIYSDEKLPPAQTIDFHFNKVESLGGLTLAPEKISAILGDLGFTFHGNQVTIPSWRHDVDCEASLVEEVLRVYGYDHLPVVALPAAPFAPALSPSQKRLTHARRLLVSHGMTEVVTWSFLSAEKAALFDGGDASLILQNPISVELEVMRPSLLPNLLDIADKNGARGFTDLALFEIGPVFYGIKPEDQHTIVAGIRTGNTAPKSHYHDSRAIDLFDAKGDALAVLAECGISTEKLTISRESKRWYHPGRSGSFILGKTTLGWFGELHPSLLTHWDIKGTVVGFEINMGALPLPKSKQGRKPAPNFSDYQAVTRDFAFIVDHAVAVDTIIKAAYQAEKSLITNINLFDIYSGKGVDDSKKSVAFSVTLQSKEKTLTDVELDDVSKRIIAEIEKQTSGTLRK